jgi:hypothetical protein
LVGCQPDFRWTVEFGHLVWTQFEPGFEFGKHLEVWCFVRSEPAAKSSARLKQLVGKKFFAGEKHIGWRDEDEFRV